ncbi:hypothetical protein HDV57DRAFT_525734 [Trichoderma longibrachiatum]
MGLGILVFSSALQPFGRYTTQRAYVFEDDMEAALEGLAKAMQNLADPAKRRGIMHDLLFGNWMLANELQIRPFINSGRMTYDFPSITACIHRGMCNCGRAVESCSKVLVDRDRIPVGHLGFATIDIADPDLITCLVTQNVPNEQRESSEPPRHEFVDFKVRV